jgi:hypothetical protein
MDFLITIYVKKKKNLIVVAVIHHVCKLKFWFGGLGYKMRKY